MPGPYGTIPNPVNPVSTSAAATAAAIAAGNTAYGQLPGYQSSLGNIGQNIQSETAGILPPDVLRNLQQQSAERGVATGTGATSPNNNAAYLRALGLNSLQLTQMGQDNLLKQLPALPGAQISQNPAFQPNTGQRFEADTQNSVWASAPDPRAASEAAMAASRNGLAAGRGSVPGYNGMSSTAPGDFWAQDPTSWYNGGVSRPDTVSGLGAGAGAGSSATADVPAQILDRYKGTALGGGQQFDYQDWEAGGSGYGDNQPGVTGGFYAAGSPEEVNHAQSDYYDAQDF